MARPPGIYSCASARCRRHHLPEGVTYRPVSPPSADLGQHRGLVPVLHRQGGTLHVRTIAVSLGALALAITITSCSAAAQHGQATGTTPGTSTSAPAAAVTPAAGITTAPVTPEPLSGTVVPTTAAPAASAPSPSAAACFVPDIGGYNAAFASNAVKAAGFQVALVKKADPYEPNGFPAGLVWGGDPRPDETKAPCGSTVTLYVQP